VLFSKDIVQLPTRTQVGEPRGKPRDETGTISAGAAIQHATNATHPSHALVPSGD
jgi:hypothetical protein